MRVVGAKAFENVQGVQDFGHKISTWGFFMSFFYPTGAQLFSKSVFGAQPTDKDKRQEQVWSQWMGTERADM